MSQNPSQITRAARAKLYLGVTGLTAPVDCDEALDPGLRFVGLTTEDSLGFTTEPNFEEVRSHQSDYAVRRFQTTDAANASVDLQQWNDGNFKAVYGGGTVTPIAGTTDPVQYKFVPPAFGARDESMAVLEVIDGLKVYRWVFPRSQQVEGVALQLQKGTPSVLPLRLSILGGDETDPWYVLIKDPTGAFGTA